jgi:hypothetical protein
VTSTSLRLSGSDATVSRIAGLQLALPRALTPHTVPALFEPDGRPVGDGHDRCSLIWSFCTTPGSSRLRLQLLRLTQLGDVLLCREPLSRGHQEPPPVLSLEVRLASEMDRKTGGRTITTAPDELRHQLRQLRRRELLATCASFRPADSDDLLTITKLSLRKLARRVAELDEEIALLDARRRRITSEIAPALVAAHGIGPDTATGLLLAAGDNPERLGSERSRAALLAASPLPASSGKTIRHRLNPGGDRHGNSALWRIIIVRMSTDPRTKAYVERHTKEGLSKTEIIRCLKRYVARETYSLLPRELLS